MGNLTEMYRRATMTPEQIAESDAKAQLRKGTGFEQCCKQPRVRLTQQGAFIDADEPKFQCASCGTYHNTPEES